MAIEEEKDEEEEQATQPQMNLGVNIKEAATTQDEPITSVSQSAPGYHKKQKEGGGTIL